MKKLTLTAFLSILVLFAVAIVTASADSVTFTYSGDNSVIGAWEIVNGGSPTAISIPPVQSWQTASSFQLNLSAQNSYEIVWQVVNNDWPLYRPPSADNPGGFLAQISGPASYENILSSSSWQVASTMGSLAELSSSGVLNSLTWSNATLYGANNNSGTIWNSVNGGSVAGIDGSAQWIWTAANFANPGAPGALDSVFIATTITDPPPVATPEPSSMLFLGAGLVGLVGFRKKLKK